LRDMAARRQPLPPRENPLWAFAALQESRLARRPVAWKFGAGWD
jgi:hypothetical protein